MGFDQPFELAVLISSAVLAVVVAALLVQNWQLRRRLNGRAVAPEDAGGRSSEPLTQSDGLGKSGRKRGLERQLSSRQLPRPPRCRRVATSPLFRVQTQSTRRSAHASYRATHK